jgi:hypothetical protein
MLLRQHPTRWQKAPLLLRELRRISRYQIAILIVYTHSRVEESRFGIVLKEVISGIKILREDV